MIAAADARPVHGGMNKAEARPQGRQPSRNARIAAKLAEAADILAVQNADAFRVAAYRRAAEAVGRLDCDVADILAEGGRKALDAIPGVGSSIARAIAELVHTGRWRYLEQIRAAAGPITLYTSIPGVGPVLARRLHEVARLDTLEALEIGAHDGRLEAVPGIGRRRAAAIRNALAQMLGRLRPRTAIERAEPTVAMLLDVDREYREQAASDLLPKIAPRRFNPSHEAWLPVLHTRRDSWVFTVLYSNTARAHELHRIMDWVVVYFHVPGEAEQQRTVVTEGRGPLGGQRVVRGREPDCQRYCGLTA